MFTDGSTDLCWAEADLCSHYIQAPLQALASPVTGIRPLEKCRNRCILKSDGSLVLVSIFIKAKLTTGWIFTGKLCSAVRIWLGTILLFFSSFFLKSPLISTHVIFALFFPKYTKYSSFYLSRLSLDKVLITSWDKFSKAWKQRAGTNSEKM